MNVPKKHVNALIREMRKLKGLPGSFDVQLKSEVVDPAKDLYRYSAEAADFETTAITNLSKIWQTLQKAFKTISLPTYMSEYYGEREKNQDFVRVDNREIDTAIHPTVKFVPAGLDANVSGITYYPRVVMHAPYEETLGGVTYRLIANKDRYGYYNDCMRVHFCVPHTDPCYNYLDQNNIIKQYGYRKKSGVVERRHVICPELNYHTMLVFILCSFSPRFPEMLQDGCYLHPDDAQALSIRMEKALPKDKIATFKELKTIVDKEYETCTTMIALDKLQKGEVPHVVLNDIKFGASFAEYETMSLRAPDFIGTLKGRFDMSREYDIYQLIEAYCKAIVDDLEGDIEDQKENGGPANITVPEFSINGIPINVSYNARNHHRIINGYHIKSTDLMNVLFRASCETDPENYGRFLLQCSRMSLEWRDALSSDIGLPVKINRDLTSEDYANPIPKHTSPRLNFRIIDRRIHLVLDETGTTLRVKLGKLISAVKRINRLTNNKYQKGGYSRRSYTWARTQLQEALQRCTSFEHAPVTPAQAIAEIDPTLYREEAERIAAEAEREVLLAKQKKEADERTRVREQERQIKREEAVKMFELMEEKRAKAIKKSEEFLARAIRHTKAKDTQHPDGEAWLIKGKARSYKIIKETGRVYEAKTGNYICIVNHDNYKGVGFDSIASRMYALANDTMVEGMIHTLLNLDHDEEPAPGDELQNVEQLIVENNEIAESEPQEAALAEA